MIGVDVGGTHTDTCVAAGDQIVRAKAFTTHDDYSRGLIDALALAAQRLDRTLDQLLSDATALVNGTTVVTNALTELRGARVGVITTAGFRDTLRFAGGARRPVYDDQLQVSPPDVAPRDCILEVDERVTKDGSVLVALDEGAVVDAVARLRSRGVETVAICFLWSFRNPAHERRARELVREQWPDAFVTLSSDIHPVIREHERFFSAVFNSYCQPAASRLLRTVADRLAGHGFGGSLTFFSGAGGAIPGALAERFPLLLLASGPAGGVRGAIDLAERMGLDDVLVGDMGGTSFDTTLVRDRRPRIAGRLEVAGLPTAINVVDVVSIGAGGGSVAWVDERGVPQVGPQSAGSTPGPACYGRGGDRPTVTDAALVSGILDAGSYLDGRVTLDREAAFARDRALRNELRLVDRRGRRRDHATDRRQHGRRAAGRDRRTRPRPEPARADRLRRHAADVRGRDRRAAAHRPGRAARQQLGVLGVRRARRAVRAALHALAAGSAGCRRGRRPDRGRARGDVASRRSRRRHSRGSRAEDLSLRWDVELRFAGQVSELEVPLARTAFTATTASALAEAFPARYEEVYGPGTAWDGTPVMLVNLIVTATADRHRPPLEPATLASEAPPTTDRRRAVLIEGGTWLRGRARVRRRGVYGRNANRRAGDHRRARHHRAGAGALGRRSRPMAQLRAGADPVTSPQSSPHDVVQAEIHRKAMDSIAMEMGITLVRTSGSPVVTEAKDLSCSVLDERGEQIGYASFVGLHVSTSFLGVRAVLDAYDADAIEPGQAFIVNDPHTSGALHEGDVGLVMPYFHGGELVGWGYVNEHMLDVGGSGVSGFAPESRDCFSEGLRFPALRVVHDQEFDQDWVRFIANNVRSPTAVINDLRSMLAALNTGLSRLMAALADFGLDAHRRHCEVNKRLSEEMARTRIAELPDGRYRSVDWVEYDGDGTDGLHEIAPGTGDRRFGADAALLRRRPDRRAGQRRAPSRDGAGDEHRAVHVPARRARQRRAVAARSVRPRQARLDRQLPASRRGLLRARRRRHARRQARP